MIPPAQAKRVVSLNLCTDQLLVLLAPQDVAGLTYLSRDPALSFVAAEAKHLPVVPADAEAVLALHPDLVLAGTYGAQMTVALLKPRLPVGQFDEPSDFAGIARNIARLAALLGVPGRGQALIDGMQARLRALPHVARGRAVLWEAGGWTAGPGTLADAALRAAGWRDVGTGGRLSIEAMVHLRPDLLVTEAAPEFPSLEADALRHPALRGLARRDIAPALLTCGGPFSADAVERLAQ